MHKKSHIKAASRDATDVIVVVVGACLAAPIGRQQLAYGAPVSDKSLGDWCQRSDHDRT